MSALALSALLAACTVGPNYVRPSVETPPAFKEAAGWTQAQPADATPRGDWWSVFDDPLLDQLERKVEVSNQNLAAAEAAYRQATAMVSEQRAALFPTIDLSATAQRSKRASSGIGAAVPGTSTGVSVGGGNKASNQYQIGLGASWAPDVWGRIRRTIEGAKAQAQASEADLANATLSAQSELASDYVQLRADDEQKRLLDETVAAYTKSLQVTQNRYNAGVAARSDVLQAQTQLNGAQASAVDLVRQRAILEHAVAVLTGQAPANFAIAQAPWTLKAPDTPPGVPTTLLQRRPDIAAAERLAAAANAQIGVQTAAYYPDLTLTGQVGFASQELGNLFKASNLLWSLGAQAAETLVDFGARKARVKEARAAYDQAVAQYRQTVLTAFQQVEDNLAAGRVLAQEQTLRTQASQEADQAEQIVFNQYKAGQVDYTAVAVAQAAALNARVASVTTQSSRMVASVDLIAALGGGWEAPTPPR